MNEKYANKTKKGQATGPYMIEAVDAGESKDDMGTGLHSEAEHLMHLAVTLLASLENIHFSLFGPVPQTDSKEEKSPQGLIEELKATRRVLVHANSIVGFIQQGVTN